MQAVKSISVVPAACRGLRRRIGAAVAGAWLLLATVGSVSATVIDLGASGVANDGVPVGGATVGAEAKYGTGALATTGAGHLAIGGDLADLDVTGGVSYMAWLRLDGVSERAGLLMLGACCSPRNGYTLGLLAGGELRMWAGSDANDFNHNLSTTAANIDDGVFHHVGVRIDRTGVQILVDGIVRASSAASTLLPSSPSQAGSAANAQRAGVDAIRIGGPNIDGYARAGSLLFDDVRVYGRALDDAAWAAAMAGLGPDPDRLFYTFEPQAAGLAPARGTVPAPAPWLLMLPFAAALAMRSARRRC